MKPVLWAMLLLLLAAEKTSAAEPPLVAIAASLRQVWPALMEQYSPSGGATPRVSFGSSGNLARQILQGAPFELFLSADQSYPQWLLDKGATQQPAAIYAHGRLAWVAPKDSALAIWLNESADASPSAAPPVKRLSIANPAFAPYGRAARSVLTLNGIGENVQLTLGENAVQALQFALSGASDGGIVPLALVTELARDSLPAMLVRPIASHKHESLVHSMILIGEPSPSAQALFDFMRSDTAQAVLVQNGFEAAP